MTEAQIDRLIAAIEKLASAHEVAAILGTGRPALIERGEDAFSATGFLGDFSGITPAELDNAADRIVKAIERANLTASAAHGELLQALLGKRRAVA